MQILVVEPSIVTRHLLDATLRKWGYETLVVTNDSEAWEVLKTPSAPRLVLLEGMSNIPGMNGLDLIRKVRTTRPRPYTYMMIVTSRSSREDLIEGMEAGADDYLTKPFDQHELRARLGAAIRILELDQEPSAPLPVAPPTPIQFYSLFISYSSKDILFVERLYEDLTAKGVSCWFAPEDLESVTRSDLRLTNPYVSEINSWLFCRKIQSPVNGLRPKWRPRSKKSDLVTKPLCSQCASTSMLCPHPKRERGTSDAHVTSGTSVHGKALTSTRQRYRG